MLIVATLADTLRTAHLDLIEDNAFDCLVRRKQKVRDSAGGFVESEFFVGVVRARLYQSGGGGRYGAREDISIAGLREEDQGWGLLCADQMQVVDPDTGAALVGTMPTDVKFGPNVCDSFETAFGDFEIVTVFPRQDEGEVWGFDCIAKRTT